MKREMPDLTKNVDMSELRSRVRPFTEAAAQMAKMARDTVRERTPSSDEVLKQLGLERRRKSASSAMSAWLLLLGAAIGAALVFFFDTEQGARRRALVRDRFV